MITTEIIEFAEKLMDGETIEETLGIQLADHIKNWVEAKRKWRMLIKENSDNSFGPSDNFLTAKDLPSDFSIDKEVLIGDNDSVAKYTPIPFEQRRVYRNSGERYCIDMVNSKMYIHGSVAGSKTIYLYYIYQTDELEADTSPVWPERFHKLIGFLMAEIYLAGVDAGEMSVQPALEHSKEGQIILDAMENWDDELQLQAINHSTPVRGTRQAPRTDVVDRS